jgi:hypothetical protein
MTLRRLLCVVLSLVSLPTASPVAARPKPRSPVVEVAAAAGLRPEVLRLALRAHARARASGLTMSPVLTVIDYSLPSRTRRLWVLDVRRGRVLARELVAHGRNSGDDVPHRFSNRSGSLQSSLGLFLTGGVYKGKHGLSLRLRGLDPRLNGRAEERAIVVHGADYVNQRTIAALGRLGRSQGCPALDPAVAVRVIELIRDGTALFAYHPSATRGFRLAAR